MRVKVFWWADWSFSDNIVFVDVCRLLTFHSFSPGEAMMTWGTIIWTVVTSVMLWSATLEPETTAPVLSMSLTCVWMSSRYSRKEAQCSAAAVTVSIDTIVQGLLALSQFLLQLRDEVYIELRNLVLAKLCTSEKYMSICPRCFTLLKSVCTSALPDFLPAIVPSTQTYTYWELYNLDWIVPRHFQCHCSFLQIALQPINRIRKPGKVVTHNRIFWVIFACLFVFYRHWVVWLSTWVNKVFVT